MPDMAGEAVLEEVDHPHTYRVVRSFLQKCTAAMILIDAASLRQGTREQDYFTMKLLSYLNELTENNRQTWARRPVAVVLTKADQSEECRAGPASFAERHAVGLWQYCRERFECHRFFAASVAGACAYRDTFADGRVQVPLRIEPHGLIEPFEWLLDNLPPK